MMYWICLTLIIIRIKTIAFADGFVIYISHEKPSIINNFLLTILLLTILFYQQLLSIIYTILLSIIYT